MKKKLVAFCLILFSFSLFAQSSSDLIDALKSKNIQEITSILSDCSSEDAPLFEEVILEESRKAVKKDDLDYAYQLAEIVLMNNFDNEAAQNLFTSIEKAKKSKAEIAAKEAEKERKRQEEEEQKRKLEEYQAFKQEEENKKIEHEKAVSTISKSNFPILIGLSPASFSFQNSEIINSYKNASITDFRYGAGVFINAGFEHPFFLVNLHANYNFSFVSSANGGMKSLLETRLTFGTPIISKYVRISAGYNLLNYINSNQSVLFTNTYYVHAGAGVENINIGKYFVITCFADFNTLTFASPYINFAFDVDFTLRYNLPFKLFTKGFYIESNTVFNAAQVMQKWEYTADTRIVLGVYLNE